MRTLPKSLAKFQQIVNERGEGLRTLSFEDLKQEVNQSTQHFSVESRPATISVIVQPRPDGSLRVVVQGFMKARHLPGKHVAIDGFYKHPDGTVTPMDSGEFYEFD
jgi:hypothetical protein